MPTDLERAYQALNAKQRPYSTLWDYYDGQHPLVYSTKRLRQIFNRIDAKFSENWCAVVVDSVLDRLNLARFTVAKDEAATERLNDLWERTQMGLDSDDAHTAALVTGEAYVIAWREEGGEVECYYNDPRLVHLFYDPDRPRVKQFAAKWWVDGDEKRRITLYYPDRLAYYVSTKQSKDVSSAKDFGPADPAQAPNPWGIIPVFHVQRERRRVKSELVNVIEPQDAINKLLADMMVAAEFGAFRQRYIISNVETQGRLKNAPNEIWDIPAGDGQGQQTQVGEFSQTDLGGYLTAIDKLATAIAIITRTPKHYLFNQVGDPSGESLIAMEAPLVKKCQKYVERFGAAWGEVAAFLLRLDGLEVDEQQIEPVFDQVETVQPRTEAEIRNLAVQAGLPLKTHLRKYEGWTDAELAALDTDKQEEQAAAQTSLANGILEAQRRFDQGGGQNGG
jgi:hypothetical protein